MCGSLATEKKSFMKPTVNQVKQTAKQVKQTAKQLMEDTMEQVFKGGASEAPKVEQEKGASAQRLIQSRSSSASSSATEFSPYRRTQSDLVTSASRVQDKSRVFRRTQSDSSVNPLSRVDYKHEPILTLSPVSDNSEREDSEEEAHPPVVPKVIAEYHPPLMKATDYARLYETYEGLKNREETVALKDLVVETFMEYAKAVPSKSAKEYDDYTRMLNALQDLYTLTRKKLSEFEAAEAASEASSVVPSQASSVVPSVGTKDSSVIDVKSTSSSKSELWENFTKLATVTGLINFAKDCYGPVKELAEAFSTEEVKQDFINMINDPQTLERLTSLLDHT